MDEKVILAAIIYAMWAVLIGYFIPVLSPLSAIIAAFVAGIYVARGEKTTDGMSNGMTAGVLGGLLLGVAGIYIKNISGISLSVSTALFVVPNELTSVPYLSGIILGITGLAFGGIGGIIGAGKKLGGVYLFLTLLVLFIFYGAIDNLVWNWGAPNWTWNQSISHVLTNRIDLGVAAGFAIAVTMLAYVLRIER